MWRNRGMTGSASLMRSKAHMWRCPNQPLSWFTQMSSSLAVMQTRECKQNLVCVHNKWREGKGEHSSQEHVKALGYRVSSTTSPICRVQSSASTCMLVYFTKLLLRTAAGRLVLLGNMSFRISTFRWQINILQSFMTADADHTPFKGEL